MNIQLGQLEVGDRSPLQVRDRVWLALGRYAAEIRELAVSVVTVEEGACGFECQLALTFERRPRIEVSTRHHDGWSAFQWALDRCERTVARRLAVARMMQGRASQPVRCGLS